MYSLLDMGIFHGYLTLPECIFLRILVPPIPIPIPRGTILFFAWIAVTIFKDLDHGTKVPNGYGWQVPHRGKMIRERNCYRFLVVKLQLCKSWLIWNDRQLVKHDLYIYIYIYNYYIYMHIYINSVFFSHDLLQDSLLLKVPWICQQRSWDPELWVQGFESFNDTLNSMFIAGVPRYEKLLDASWWRLEREMKYFRSPRCERWLSCFLILAIHVHINIELWALKTRYLWMFWHNFLEKVIFVWSDVEWDQPLQSPLQLLWKITDSQITTSVHPPSSNLQGPLFTWQRSTWGKESSDKALVMIWYNHPELQCCTLDALNLDWIYL